MRLRRREWVVLAVFLVLAVLVGMNIKRVEVKGASMEPAYHDGDTVIVWKTAPRRRLKPGDVIVFRSAEGDEFIKRIVYIAKPGAARFPPVDFPRVLSTPSGLTLSPNAPPGWTFQGYFDRVLAGRIPPPPPQNTIYVLGDNLGNSRDSRDFGPIDPSVILGKAIP